MKTLLGHCLLKYSPKSCHWYLHKNVPAVQFHLQQLSPLVRCVWPRGTRAAVPVLSSEGLPFVLSPHKPLAVKSRGVCLHPGCGECWWGQDHEPAPCEIPVSTLHWDTGFSDIITFWDLSVGWFLSLLVGICKALCTEMLGFFSRMLSTIKWNALQCQAWQCHCFYQSNASQRKSNTKFNRNTALCSFAYTYKKAINLQNLGK